MLTNPDVLDPKVHCHTSKALPVGQRPTLDSGRCWLRPGTYQSITSTCHWQAEWPWHWHRASHGLSEPSQIFQSGFSRAGSESAATGPPIMPRIMALPLSLAQWPPGSVTPGPGVTLAKSLATSGCLGAASLTRARTDSQCNRDSDGHCKLQVDFHLSNSESS